MKHFAIFGIHPRVSLAEFHAVKTQISTPVLVGNGAVCEDEHWNGEELMDILGGTTKLGDIVATIPADDLTAGSLADALPRIPTTSFDFGCTVFASASRTRERFEKLPIALKKAFKARGVSSRWVTGEGNDELSPAAVSKLKLTSRGLDVCIFIDSGTAYIGLTAHVQDADAWSLRDFGRPARSEEKGMLPPKLARILVNLSTPSWEEGAVGVLIDPFCGSGTILMEAALATNATKIIGSDNDAKQISDAQKNIAWLLEKKILLSGDEKRFETIVLDARKLSQRLKPSSVERVVTEGYLGQLLRGNETLETLKRNAAMISDLWKATLTELKPLLASNARLVCIWPAFKTEFGVARVDLEQDLAALGFEMIDPFMGWDVPAGPLLYHRAGQRVMRRIVLIKPK